MMVARDSAPASVFQLIETFCGVEDAVERILKAGVSLAY